MAVNKLGYKSIGNFKGALLQLFQAIEVKRIFSEYRVSKEDLKSLAPQMFTPERSDNNLRSVNVDEVQNILKRSI